jgi:hypothetical protein
LLERCRDEALEESRALDFKRQRYDLDRGDRSKRDLVENICAFANTAGGLILLGVDELEDDEGRRGSRMGMLRPFDLSDFASYRDRVYELARNSFEPRFDGIKIRDIRSEESATEGVIAIGVERSVRAPHRVKSFESFQFMNRTMRSTERMDVEQIREAFRHAFESARDSEERLIAADDRATGIMSTPWDDAVWFWAIAVPIFRDALRFPIRDDAVREALQSQRDTHRFHEGGQVAYDELGAVLWNSNRRVQLDRVRRDGAIERFDLVPIDTRLHRVSHAALARSLAGAFGAFRQLRESLGIVGPGLVSTVLSGINGLMLAQIRLQPNFSLDSSPGQLTLASNRLSFRKETTDEFFGPTLKEIADSIWQSAGHRDCQGFDENGEQTPALLSSV